MSRKVTDRASIGGAGTVPDKGVRERMYQSGMGAGELTEYWDTEDKIKRQQDMGMEKMKKNLKVNR